jgi:hypothetical protein
MVPRTTNVRPRHHLPVNCLVAHVHHPSIFGEHQAVC